jgi:Elongation factor Tu GTP binding domain
MKASVKRLLAVVEAEKEVRSFLLVEQNHDLCEIHEPPNKNYENGIYRFRGFGSPRRRLTLLSLSFHQTGNIEYKRQVSPSASPSRYVSLSTQMSFRLDEGQGQCVYRIGVEDDGCHSLLSYQDVAESCRVLELIARSLNALVVERKMIQNEVKRAIDGTHELTGSEPLVVLEPPMLGDANGPRLEPPQETKDDGLLDKESGFTRAELTIHRVETHLLDPPQLASNQAGAEDSKGDQPASSADASSADGHSKENLSVSETLSSRNIRVAVVGNVDAGKSTLIGSLTTSMLDDGRGKCRTSIMKHRHEIETGRTSTSTTHLMGFRSTGEPIAGKDQIRTNKRKGEDEIARESYRVITLMDLAGHEKYLKTT